MRNPSHCIPVLMYHSVGPIIADWNWNFLTVPAETFENHLLWLSKAGYQTIDLDELYNYVWGKQELPLHSVVLTFDDGYLDNWVYAAPLLNRYGFKGTVFVGPDFVDPREIVRPTLEDVWGGSIDETKLDVRGFMSWKELRELDKNGPLRVESHAMTHTWYPSGPEIVDFHHPNDGYYWLDWNVYPDEKPFYLSQPQNTKIPFGTPVYEHHKALAGTRYLPDLLEAEHMTEFVKYRGGNEFFKEKEWRGKLFAEARRFRQKYGARGRYESSEERRDRYQHELAGAKNIIEDALEREIRFLCWPGGGYNELSRTMALGLYTAVTLGSADPSPVRNRPGDDPKLIKRLGVPTILEGAKVYYPSGRYLVQALKEYQGSGFARKYRQVMKAMLLLKKIFSR